jgi:tetratricopeptide (TPR) repeat protein
MILLTPYTGAVNDFIDHLPDKVQKLKDIWQGLVDWFINAVILKVSDSYWPIARADYILAGVFIFILVIIIVVILLVRSRFKGGKTAGRPLSKGELKGAAKRAAKAGNYVRAGELYEQAENFNKAVDMFKRGNAFTKAAQVQAKRMNQPDKAIETLTSHQLWEAAGKLQASLGRHDQAAEHFLKAGKEQMAAESYEKALVFTTAGDLYKKHQRFSEAARCYSQAKAWKPTAEMYAEMYKQYRNTVGAKMEAKDLQKLQEMAKKAAYFWKQAGQLKSAADILLEARLPAMAAELMVMNGDLKEAAELLIEEKDLKKAAELLYKAGDKHRSAEVLAQYHQNEGRPLEAAKFLELSENYLAAADIWAGQSQFEKAAELYFKGGDSRTAAAMYVAAGKSDRAVKVLEQVGDMETAARIIEESGDQMSLAAMYERQRKLYEAAVIYHDNGHADLALPLLQKISPDHPGFGDACYRLGVIFMEKKMYDKALESLQAMAGRIPLAPNTLDYYYLLGLALEQSNHAGYAAQVYQQIAAMNYNFKDVVIRLNALVQKLQKQHAATAPGQAIAHRYKLIKEIGRGGMGIVFLAEDTKLGRKVAYKVLPEEFKTNAEMVNSFKSEFMNLAKLNHPYIVSLIDAGEESGAYYIIMEYVEGKNFKELMGPNKRLPLAAATMVFSQLCQALEYAHGMQIIHRDIKPANVMWIQSHSIIKVMDFGLAKVMDKMREGRTVVAGTPFYMSPEQTLGRNVDHRSDIYSMGVTMYELMTGSVPFKDGDIGYAHMHTPPEPPSRRNPQITPELEKIVLKCLAKDVNQRYQSARQINDELLLVSQRSK